MKKVYDVANLYYPLQPGDHMSLTAVNWEGEPGKSASEWRCYHLFVVEDADGTRLVLKRHPHEIEWYPAPEQSKHWWEFWK